MFWKCPIVSSWSGNEKAILRQIEDGFDINFPNIDGTTALMEAASHGTFNTWYLSTYSSARHILEWSQFFFKFKQMICSFFRKKIEINYFINKILSIFRQANRKWSSCCYGRVLSSIAKINMALRRTIMQCMAVSVIIIRNLNRLNIFAL